MLPFLKPEKITSVIVANRKPNGSVMPSHEEGDENAALHSAAEDLIRAAHAKDIPQVANALRAAFEICRSEPEQPSEDIMGEK